MGDDSSRRLHVVMFPWLAFGHMLPFVELSKALATRGHRISYISTPRNIQRLPPPNPSTNLTINYIPFPLPPTRGLPESTDSTFDLPPGGDSSSLRNAFDSLDQPFATFIQECNPKPDWIFLDFAHGWTRILPIAAEFDIPCARFNVFHPAATAFLGPVSEKSIHELRPKPEDWTVSPPWISFPSKVAFRPFEVRRMFSPKQTPENSEDNINHYKQLIRKICKAMVMRSSTEVDSNWLNELSKIYREPIIPVGLLLPTPQTEDSTDRRITDWLDRQKPRSVVYVALGSEVVLGVEQMRELALGLELSGLHFLWVIRNETIFFPEGFEERINKNCGMITFGWVNQVSVLSHGSICGSLMHAGWGSVIENIQFGHPIVMLPMVYDQGLNARVMEEKGIGVEVDRDEEDGSFTRESVAGALRLVMVLDEGEKYRKQAREMKVDRESQEKFVDGLCEYLSTYSQMRKEEGGVH